MNNKINFLLIALFLMILEIPCASAGTKDFVFKEGHLAMLAPPIINKKYYLIEFGFLTEKKIKSWDYNYNAYVTAALFEDWLNQKDKLRAGALGFKGGVLAPTQPWIPLLFSLTGGFAKTVLHNQPLLGREDKAAGKKTMFLLEAGLLYRYDKYFAKFSYQLSNVKYFKRHTFLTLGVNY